MNFHGSGQKAAWRQVLTFAFQQPVPAEIVGKVMSCHAMKSPNPCLKPTVVGIHVLDVIDLGDDPNAGGEVDRSVSNADFSGGSAQRLSAVSTQHGIVGQERLECGADVFFIRFFQHEVGSAPVRSRQISTGICSADKPRFEACPPWRRSSLVMPCFWPLNDSRKKVSSTSAMPVKCVACC